MSPRVACPGVGDLVVVSTPPKKDSPKAVVKGRSFLASKGVSLEGLTGADLYKNMDPKEVNKLASGFRNAMTPQARAAYKEVSTADRRDWLAQYLVDPEQGTSVGFTTTAAVNSRMAQSTEAWITQAEMGGPQWLNDTSQAKVLCDSGELQSRPHERPCLAAAGVLQFEFSKAQVSPTEATN